MQAQQDSMNNARKPLQRRLVHEDMTVGFIGAGRMAQAMARGLISTGLLKPQNITASDPDPRMLNFIEKLGVRTTTTNKEVIQNSTMVVLAVKPNLVPKVLTEVKDQMSKDKLLVSIAAGVTIDTLEKNLNPGSRVVRVMPNINVLVLESASVVSTGSSTCPQDGELVQELFNCIGLSEQGTEYMLDAVTGLSGSGPAYAFCAIEALADGGVKMGLPRDLSMKLAAQTLLGAAKMVLDTGKHPGQLKDEVCSPGGTTISAMHSLERSGFRACLIDAVEVATLKAKELGEKSEEILRKESEKKAAQS